jgi:DNA-binding transcriptional MerR regulator
MEQDDRGARHPIRVVAERTGLTPHVLRAWERRYGVVTPLRTEGGQRFYTDDDIRRLSLLNKASHAGRAVGQIAQMSTDALAQLVAQDADQGAARLPVAADHRALAMAAVRDMAPDRLRAVLHRALLSLGTTAFLDSVLTPILQDVGTEWHAGRIGIAHEHAASAAVEQLLAWLVQELQGAPDAPHVLLATPAGQRHTQGALIAAVAAAHDGWRVTWLGADLPAAQISAAATRHSADVVGLSVATAESADQLRAEVDALRDSLNARTPLYVGGMAASVVAGADEVTVVRDLTHWRNLLRSHATSRPNAA